MKIVMKKQTNWEEAWTQYEDMIYKVAHQAMNKYGSTGVSFDEIVSESWMFVMKKMKHYDPKKSAKSTWVWTCAYYGAKNYCVNRLRKKEYSLCVNMSALDQHEEKWEPEAKRWIDSLMEEIGEEARELVQTILEAPDELREVMSPTSPYKSNKAIESYMIDVLDWTRKDLLSARQEIISHLV